MVNDLDLHWAILMNGSSHIVLFVTCYRRVISFRIIQLCYYCYSDMRNVTMCGLLQRCVWLTYFRSHVLIIALEDREKCHMLIERSFVRFGLWTTMIVEDTHW